MDIVYRIGGDGFDGVLFAKRESAERVAKIRDALHNSKTWGEVRAKLPDGEWESTFQNNFDEVPGDDEPFGGPDCAPGFADGDYPEWLRASQLDWLPEELIERYGGTLSRTMLNGDALDLPADKAEQIAEELRTMGHKVERTNLDIT